jgi:phage-related holin
VVLDFLVTSTDAKSVRQIYSKMVLQDILLAIKVLMVIRLVIFQDEMQCQQNNEREMLMI